MRDRLSAYAYPRKIEFVDELPKTLTGKIRRIELRQAELERRSSSGDVTGFPPGAGALIRGLVGRARIRR